MHIERSSSRSPSPPPPNSPEPMNHHPPAASSIVPLTPDPWDAHPDAIKQLNLLDIQLKSLMAQKPLPVDDIKLRLYQMMDTLGPLPSRGRLYKEWEKRMDDWKARVTPALQIAKLEALTSEPMSHVLRGGGIAVPRKPMPDSDVDAELPYLDRLEKELHGLADDLMRIWDNFNSNKDAYLPEEEIHPKLAILEKLIDKIPDECSETSAQWTRKLDYLQGKFSKAHSLNEQRRMEKQQKRLESDCRSPGHCDSTMDSSKPNSMVQIEQQQPQSPSRRAPSIQTLKQQEDYDQEMVEKIETRLQQLDSDIERELSSSSASGPLSALSSNALIDQMVHSFGILTSDLQDIARKWMPRAGEMKIRYDKARQSVRQSKLSSPFTRPVPETSAAALDTKQQLQQELSKLEMEIGCLMVERPLPPSVESRLATMMDKIQQIAALAPQAQDEWSDRVSVLMQKFVQASTTAERPEKTKIVSAMHQDTTNLEAQLKKKEATLAKLISSVPFPKADIEEGIGQFMELIDCVSSADAPELAANWAERGNRIVETYADACLKCEADLQDSASLEAELKTKEAAIRQLLSTVPLPKLKLAEGIAQFMEQIDGIRLPELAACWAERGGRIVEAYADVCLKSDGDDDVESRPKKDDVPRQGPGPKEDGKLERSNSLDELRACLSVIEPAETVVGVVGAGGTSPFRAPVSLVEEQPRPQTPTPLTPHHSDRGSVNGDREFHTPTRSEMSYHESYSQNQEQNWNKPEGEEEGPTMSMDEARRRIETGMSTLPQIESSDDHLGLQNLLLVTGKLRRMLDPFYPDRNLPNEVFAYALSKLDSGTLQLFDQSGERRQLNGLIVFLRNQITEYAGQLATESGGDSSISCNFCKNAGHRAFDCPKIKCMLCFRCFEFGHNVKRCQKEQLAPEAIFA